MPAGEALTSQDWYRVRRGEDEIAWGKTHADPALPGLSLSRRSVLEWAFLEPDQKAAVRDALKRLASAPAGKPEPGLPVMHGGDRRITRAGALRIIWRRHAGGRHIEISTLRGGKVCDPENVGPPPFPFKANSAGTSILCGLMTNDETPKHE